MPTQQQLIHRSEIQNLANLQTTLIMTLLSLWTQPPIDYFMILTNDTCMHRTQNSNPYVLSHNPAAEIQGNQNKKTNRNACLFNARSIVNKLYNFQRYIYSMDFAIVALTETWLAYSIFNNEILPVGFTIYRKDCGSRGGGIMLAARDYIPSKLLSSPDNVEIITVY